MTVRFSPEWMMGNRRRECREGPALGCLGKTAEDGSIQYPRDYSNRWFKATKTATHGREVADSISQIPLIGYDTPGENGDSRDYRYRSN
jgi:hypothetical protein